MAGFYANIALKGVAQSHVVDALRMRRAAVTAPVDDIVVVFDSVCDEQNTGGMCALAEHLSRKLRCPALTVLVHDDDVLLYWCFVDGELVDQYNSSPAYFSDNIAGESDRPTGGNSRALCQAFTTQRVTEIHDILHRGDYVFESDRLRDLSQALGRPSFVVGTALASLDRGEVPEELAGKQLLRAADPPATEDPQTRDDRRFYDLLGKEDPTRPCRRDGCSRGAIPLGVFCRPHHFESVRGRPCPFDAD